MAARSGFMQSTRFNRVGSVRFASAFMESYDKLVQERAAEGIPPLPLNAEQCSQLVELAQDPKDEGERVAELLSQRVPPGVDEAAYVKVRNRLG